MIEFEKLAGWTPMPLVVDEGASFTVASEDLPADGSGDVTGLRLPRLSRSLRLAEPLLFELGEQAVERSLEDDGKVSARIAMAHKRGSPFELVAELGAHGER